MFLIVAYSVVVKVIVRRLQRTNAKLAATKPSTVIASLEDYVDDVAGFVRSDNEVAH